MVKSIKSESVSEVAHDNNMRLDFIDDMIKAVSDLPEEKYTHPLIASAIKKLYNASFELEDAITKIQ